MSQLLIKILTIEYIAIAIVCIFERDYTKMIYWVGASLLNYAVLTGMK